MIKLRKSLAIRTFSVFLAIITLNLTFSSCKKKDDSGNSDTPTVPAATFNGNSVEMKTDASGRYNLSTSLSSQGEDFNLNYQFKLVDNAGNPIQGVTITYTQVNEKSIIYIYDESGRYASTYFIGTPRELEAYFGNSMAKSGPYEPINTMPGEQHSTKEGEFIVTLTILAIIALASITYAQIGIIMNAYKIQKFYLSDYVSETEDYILYCKTFEEIAELIKARTNITLNVASIFVSFISMGGGSTALAIEIPTSVGSFTAEELRDEFVGQAIEAWGVSMNNLAGRKLAVKVFPYEEDQTFANARNLFATYTIEYDNPICQSDGHISGKITDAETGSPINNVTVNLTGEVTRTDFTNSSGDYSFEDLPNGYYDITVSKTGYISETKNVLLDGTSIEANFVLSKELGGSEYRIVLTWGAVPEDMDLHLFTDNGDHIYWNDQGSLYSYPYIYLDIDDISSFGPETITIKQLQASSVYVHNYTGSPDIKQSESDVKVYRGSSLLKHFTVPSSGNGQWWYIFDITSGGTIIDQDYLIDNKVDLPNKSTFR